MLNAIQENTVDLTDMQLRKHCDQTEATIALKTLEDKLADQNNDPNGEDDDSIALGNELEAQSQVLTSSQDGVTELQALIDTLQNYSTEVTNSAMYEVLNALKEQKIKVTVLCFNGMF